MDRTEAYEFYGEGGTFDYLDEIEEDGKTLREVMAERQIEATRKIRSEIYAGLLNYEDDS